MNRKVKMFFKISSSAIPLFLCSNLSACFSNTQPIVIDSCKITFPKDLIINKTLTDTNETYTIVSGFHFQGLKEFNRLKISESFNTPFGIVKTEIVNWDNATNSFSVSVFTKDVGPGSFSGNLSFKYDGEDVELINPNPIILNFNESQIIRNPDNFNDSQHLDENNDAVCKFANFSTTGLDDLTKLTVSCNFNVEGATFTPRIEVKDENSFDVFVDIKNAKPRMITGNLFFFFDGKQLNDTPKDEFSIHLKEYDNIIESTDKNKNMIANVYGVSTILFKNFSYSGIDPSELEVSTTFASSLQYSSFSCEIINVSSIAKLFDVQVVVKDPKHCENIQGSFTFKLPNRTWTTSDDYTISIKTSLNIKYLDVGVKDSLFTLKGFKVDNPPLSDVDTILVPNFIEVIGEQAFFQKELINMSFEEGTMLHTISYEAFAESKNLSTIVIPGSVKEIESRAFGFASGIQSIQFEESNIPLHIDGFAFYETSSLTNFSFPKRTRTIDVGVMAKSTVEELYIPSCIETVNEDAFSELMYLKSIYVNDPADELPKWMVQYVPTDDKGIFDKWVGHKVLPIFDKIIYIPNSDKIDMDDASNIIYNNLKLPTDWKIMKK